MNKNTIILLMKLAQQKLKDQIDTENPNLKDCKMVLNFIDRSLGLLDILGDDDIIVIDNEEVDEVGEDNDIDQMLDETFGEE